MKTRSKTYNSTVTNDFEGLSVITQIRLEAKIFNLQEKIKGLSDSSYSCKHKRIALFGRLGKNNPNAHVYRTLAAKQRKTNWFGAHAYQRISMKHAATIDIYMTLENK